MKKYALFALLTCLSAPLFSIKPEIGLGPTLPWDDKTADCRLPTVDSLAPLLTANEAVRIALENNYGIQIERGNAEIAHLNNIKANAGMVPVVNLVANDNFSYNAFYQQLSNGNEFAEAGAPFNTINAAVQLNWTIYDGRRMYIAKDRLEQQELLGQHNLEAVVQQTTANVLQSYYQIVGNRLQEIASAELIALTDERLRIAEARLAAGFAASSDALQARIDLNQQRATLVGQEYSTSAAKRRLNLLLIRPAETAFSVDENMTNTYVPEREALLTKLQTQNPALLAAMTNVEVATLQAEEAQTLNKLRVQALGQLGGTRTDNGAGFLLNNTQAGVTVGFGVVLPLYTGGNLRRQMDVASVQARQAVFLADDFKLTLENNLDEQIAFFQAQQEVLTIEEETVISARENLRVSTERFRLGQTTSLEVQTAQNSLAQSLNRRNLVLFGMKVAEVQLRLIAGEL